MTISVAASTPPKEKESRAARKATATAVAPEPKTSIKAEPPLQSPLPLDPKTIESLQIDPNTKRLLLEGTGELTPVAPPDTSKSAPEAMATPAGVRGPRDAKVATNTTIVGTSQTTNDTNQDYEPAIIVNRFSGVDRATTVFMKYDTNTMNPNLHFRTTTDFVNYTGGALPLPTGHNRSADPMLSENPYVSLGQFPKRTYCSGVSVNINGSNQYTGGSLNVWHTDNPGSIGWTLTTVDSVSAPDFLDKPSIWVSWASADSSVGYTYLAAVYLSGGTNTLRVYRKTTSNTWTQVNNQFSGNGLQSPIITVDANTGYVYLAWVNWNNSTINIARSTNQGVNFGNAVSFNAGPILGAGGSICDSNNANCLRAASVIMARPNAVDNSIGVVWHRLDTTTSTNTDVYFNSFDYATQTWGTAVRVNDVTTGDQWNPALDPDGNGNYFVQWYDRRGDANDRKYRTFGARIDANGAALEPSNVTVYDTARESETNQFPADSGSMRYMGEYQDIWEWFGTWYSVTMYAPDPANGGSGQPDVYITRIQP